MNKLTNQQIEQVNQKLIDYGFTFIDARIEVLDHILCLIDEKENKSFEEATLLVFEEQNGYLKAQKLMQWTNLTAQRVTLLKDIFLNPVFILLWIVSYFIYDNLPYSNYKVLFDDLKLMPFTLPAFSIIILGYYTFTSKNKVASAYGALFTISFLLMFYLYFGIHWIKKMDQFPSLVMFSGFTAISLMLYYLPLFYKIKNERKFKALLKQ